MKKTMILFLFMLGAAGLAYGADNQQENWGAATVFNSRSADDPSKTSEADTEGGISKTMPDSVNAVKEAPKKILSAAPVTEEADEGQEAYDSLTVTADFNYRPAYVESKYANNDLIQDIAVSAVEAVPFGFILAFMGIFVYEAGMQGSFQPKLGTLQDYTPAYAVTIGSLAALNVIINTVFFYDYKKEKINGEKD